MSLFADALTKTVKEGAANFKTKKKSLKGKLIKKLTAAAVGRQLTKPERKQTKRAAKDERKFQKRQKRTAKKLYKKDRKLTRKIGAAGMVTEKAMRVKKGSGKISAADKSFYERAARNRGMTARDYYAKYVK